MKNRLNQYQNACDKFIAIQLQDEQVIGILGCGSFFNGKIDENSDIDIFVVLADDVDFRKRGNTWIDGVEIEYFKNPPKQIREYFRTETHKHSTHIFSTGKILYDKNGVVADLKNEAKQIEDGLFPPMQTSDKELAKYFIDDKYKDWEDALLKRDKIAQKHTQFELEGYCITTFFKLNRQRKGKSKYLGKTIRNIDSHFAFLIEKGDIRLIKEYIEKMLGGKRSKEWKYKSNLTI